MEEGRKKRDGDIELSKEKRREGGNKGGKVTRQNESRR